LKTVRQFGQFILLVATLLSVSFSSAGSEEEAGPQGVDLIAVINGQFGESPTFGSGIIFGREKDRLHIVTANHVVRNGEAEAGNLRIKLKPWPDKEFKARLLPQVDRELDLAVLSVQDLVAQGVDVCKLSLDRLADPASVNRGDDVLPVGDPNGVAWGMPIRSDAISDVTGDSVTFQSTLIARGHSGGGLLGASGQLIGMIQADEPPYGRALAMRRILEVLRAWNLPVQLHLQSPDGSPALFGAARRGDLGEAKLLLREVCADVNATVGNHITPVQVAAAHGHSEMVRLLVDAGANVNVKDEKGHTALQVAALRGWTEIVKLLAQAGADVNVKDEDDHTPMEVAADNGQWEMVKVLAEAGANVNSRNWGSIPLDRAVRSGNVELVEFLISHGARVTPRNARCALLAAASMGALGVVKALLANGADPNLGCYQDESALFSFILRGWSEQREAAQEEVLRTLITAGANVNWVDSHGDRPLTIALEYRKYAAVRILLEAGANLNVKDRSNVSPIGRVAEPYGTPGQRELAALLVQFSPKIEPEDGHSLLMHAVREGWAEVVNLLLQRGVIVRSEELNKTLDDAATNGQAEVARVLLQAGADPNGGVGGRRPLLDVLDYEQDPVKRLETVKVLVSKGAKVNVYNEPGTLSLEPLYKALIGHSPPDLKVVEVLIAHGANVNATDNDGQTLLDEAIREHLSEAVELLRKSGAKRGRFSR